MRNALYLDVLHRGRLDALRSLARNWRGVRVGGGTRNYVVKLLLLWLFGPERGSGVVETLKRVTGR